MGARLGCARAPASVAAAAERTRTIAATIAYALILGQADVTPWLVPAIGRYFALGPAAAIAVGVGGMGVLAAGLRYAARRGAGRAPPRASSARHRLVRRAWSLWEWLRTVVPPFLASCMFAALAGRGFARVATRECHRHRRVTALVVAGNAALAAPRRRAPAALAQDR